MEAWRLGAGRTGERPASSPLGSSSSSLPPPPPAAADRLRLASECPSGLFLNALQFEGFLELALNAAIVY